MPRGKASVQLYDARTQIPAGISVEHGNADVDEAIELAGADEAPRESELSEHIVGQLRMAYDELLNAPIPDHLRKLLTDLLDQEGKS